MLSFFIEILGQPAPNFNLLVFSVGVNDQNASNSHTTEAEVTVTIFSKRYW